MHLYFFTESSAFVQLGVILFAKVTQSFISCLNFPLKNEKSNQLKFHNFPYIKLLYKALKIFIVDAKFIWLKNMYMNYNKFVFTSSKLHIQRELFLHTSILYLYTL